MAKSIYEILADHKTTTSVPGYGSEVEHTIPADLFPSPEQFEDGEQLLDWANENGFTHALLQKGIQKGLIDIRATFKSCKKDEEWSEQLGQANVDSYEWKITERPNQKGSKAISKAVMETGTKMAKAMQDAGIDASVIEASLKASYKPAEVTAILDAIKE